MTPPESSRRDGSCRIAVRQRWSSGLAALVEHGGSACPAGTAAYGIGRGPHIWEIRGQNQCYLAIREITGRVLIKLNRSLSSCTDREDLLSVVDQHLVAGLSQLRTIFLQARQNDEVALVHQRSAKTRHIARACFLLIGRTATLLLGDGAGRDRYSQQRERKEKFPHCVPSF